MKNKLRDYINLLFQDVPVSKRSVELREELLSNLCDKYDDLIGKGFSEENAYQSAISGIGDVGELIDALGSDPLQNEDTIRSQKTSAIVISCGVMLYILAVIPVLVLQNIIGVIIMFALAAIATGLIVYNAVSHPKYRRRDETIVEEFKEWKSASNDVRQLRKSVSAIIWPLIVVLYFLISFYFDAWAYSWIIFILGTALQNIINLLINMKGTRS